MQLVDMTFSALFPHGVALEQMKEPALSRTIKQMPMTPQYIENAKKIATIDDVSAEEIISIAEAAGIIDETDGVHLAEKLRKMKDKSPIVLVDGIDDEP